MPYPSCLVIMLQFKLSQQKKLVKAIKTAIFLSKQPTFKHKVIVLYGLVQFLTAFLHMISKTYTKEINSCGDIQYIKMLTYTGDPQESCEQSVILLDAMADHSRPCKYPENVIFTQV